MELRPHITIVDSCPDTVLAIRRALEREPSIRLTVKCELPENSSGDTLVLAHARHIPERIETGPVVAYVGGPDEYHQLLSIQTMDRLLLTDDTLRCLPELLKAWSHQLHHFNRFSVLSRRERQVMRLLVQGLSNKDASHRLGLSERTVQKHRARIMNKMRAKSVADLVRIGFGCFSFSSD